jgi:hypothetical protein
VKSRASGRESGVESRARAAEWREGQFKYLSRDRFSLRTISEPQNPAGRIYAGSRGEKPRAGDLPSSCHPTVAACWHRYSREAKVRTRARFEPVARLAVDKNEGCAS